MTKTKALKFEQLGCVPCKQNTLALAKVNTHGIEVTPVSDRDSFTKYRVRSIPKLILVDNAGEVLDELHGQATVAELQAWFDKNKQNA